MTTVQYTVLILIIAFSAGIAAAETASEPLCQSGIGCGNSSGKIPAETALSPREIIEKPGKRDHSAGKELDWINRSYSGISVKDLTSLPPEKDAEYARYLDNGKAYVVVHPAYYLFFHKNTANVRRDGKNYTSDILDLFIREAPDTSVSRLIQEQQIIEKNFIEYISIEKKLLILIVPKDYRRHPNYPYQTLDEYARYINEITNGSESVVYLESISPMSGNLSATDLIRLFTFIKRIGATSVLVGGGYVGRCQQEFYTGMASYAAADNYFIVPEISVLSPDDVSENKATQVLVDNKMNFQTASELVISRMAGKASIEHLSSLLMNALTDMSPPRSSGKYDFVTLKKEDDTAGHADNNFFQYLCPFCITNVPFSLSRGPWLPNGLDTSYSYPSGKSDFFTLRKENDPAGHTDTNFLFSFSRGPLLLNVLDTPYFSSFHYVP